MLRSRDPEKYPGLKAVWTNGRKTVPPLDELVENGLVALLVLVNLGRVSVAVCRSQVSRRAKEAILDKLIWWDGGSTPAREILYPRSRLVFAYSEEELREKLLAVRGLRIPVRFVTADFLVFPFCHSGVLAKRLETGAYVLLRSEGGSFAEAIMGVSKGDVEKIAEESEEPVYTIEGEGEVCGAQVLSVGKLLRTLEGLFAGDGF